MRCLTYTIDIVYDCSVLGPCWRGQVHNPLELANRGERKFIGHAVACVPRDQVDMCGDVIPRSHQHGLQGIPAVIRNVSELDVEPHHSASCARPSCRRGPSGTRSGMMAFVEQCLDPPIR